MLPCFTCCDATSYPIFITPRDRRGAVFGGPWPERMEQHVSFKLCEKDVRLKSVLNAKDAEFDGRDYRVRFETR